MKVVVVYDSVFGNTKKVALRIDKALKELGHESQVLQVKECTNNLEDIELMIIGSPTRAFKPTKDIVDFIKSLNKDQVKNTSFAIYDTRIDVVKANNKFLSLMVKLFGYADDTMIKLISKKGGKILGSSQGFYVEESEGPLVDSVTNNPNYFVTSILS